MRKLMIVGAAMLPIVSGGCVSTVVGVAKAPFKVAGKAVDLATTSQDEADRNAGRKLRKQEQREGKEARKAQKRREKEADPD